MILSQAEKSAFERDGYFVQPKVVDDASVDALNARLSELITRCAAEHLAGTRKSLAFWDILRGSRDDAAVCWDTSAGPMPARPEEWEPLAMRIGHGLHLRDPLFGEFSRGPRVGGMLAELVPPRAVIAQTAVIYKQPNSDVVQFGLHQDAAYITTVPESLVLAFVALDDMDAENGALAVVPGSHRDPIHLVLAMGPDGFVPVSGEAPREAAYTPTLLSMPRGSVAFVHGRTLHASGPNRSPRPRRALIVHAISDTSRLSPTCWVQPPPGGFVPLSRSASSST